MPSPPPELEEDSTGNANTIAGAAAGGAGWLQAPSANVAKAAKDAADSERRWARKIRVVKVMFTPYRRCEGPWSWRASNSIQS